MLTGRGFVSCHEADIISSIKITSTFTNLYVTGYMFSILFIFFKIALLVFRLTKYEYL